MLFYSGPYPVTLLTHTPLHSNHTTVCIGLEVTARLRNFNLTQFLTLTLTVMVVVVVVVLLGGGRGEWEEVGRFI